MIADKCRSAIFMANWRPFRICLCVCLFILLCCNAELLRIYLFGENIPVVWIAPEEHSYFFKPVLSDEQLQDMISISGVFVQVLEQHGIKYMMYGGTLIGSYRHFGPIPWDDDIDILVDEKDREQVRKVLTALEPDYGLFTGFQWKFYPKNAARFDWFWWNKFGKWRWPCVDIFFYRENATHIMDTCIWEKDNVHLKTDTFPLVKRPYDKLWLYAPRDSQAFLNTLFNISNCVSTSVNHRNELRYNDIRTVPCKDLNMQYPFVRRETMSNGTMKETLEYDNGTVVRTVFL